MMRNKKVIGITGGSGCGKSYVSDLLRRRGIPVIDADKTAHEVMAAGTPCCREVIDFFGGEIEENGGINRGKLGEIVFSDPGMLKKLDEISYKYILAGIENKIEKEDAEMVFVDGATLIESGMTCDVMIGVIADFSARKKRIILRDGISEETARMRIQAQPSEDFYRKNCDFIIYNDGRPIDIDGMLRKVWECLK